MPKKSYAERLTSVRQMSTREISNLIDERGPTKQNGVLQRVYRERTGNDHSSTVPVEDRGAGDYESDDDGGYIDQGCGDESWADADENNY